MDCSLIVAMGKHREIGKNNELLWKLPRDMQFFKETTLHHTVVMGRKNWESIPKKFRPLPERKNIILTRNSSYKAKGAIVLNEIESLPERVEPNHKCFIIGGAEVYQLALQQKWVSEMYITHVHDTFEADTFFPFVNWEDWEVEEVLTAEKNKKNPYPFTIKRYYH